MTRSRTRAGRVVLTGAVALLGADRLRPVRVAQRPTTDTTDLTWDGQALQAIGFTTEDVTQTPPTRRRPPRQAGDRRPGTSRLRFAFSQHAARRGGRADRRGHQDRRGTARRRHRRRARHRSP